MTHSREAIALLHHASLVGDRRLVELLTHVPSGPATERPALAQCVYGTLVVRLSLSGPDNYDHP